MVMENNRIFATLVWRQERWIVSSLTPSKMCENTMKVQIINYGICIHRTFLALETKVNANIIGTLCNLLQ